MSESTDNSTAKRGRLPSLPKLLATAEKLEKEIIEKQEALGVVRGKIEEMKKPENRKAYREQVKRELERMKALEAELVELGDDEEDDA